MNAEWAQQMHKRLQDAAMHPPTAAELEPDVQQVAVRAATLAGVRRQAARLRVSSTTGQVRVEASGPGAARALHDVRTELARQRPKMVAGLRARALRRLRP